MTWTRAQREALANQYDDDPPEATPMADERLGEIGEMLATRVAAGMGDHQYLHRAAVDLYAEVVRLRSAATETGATWG